MKGGGAQISKKNINKEQIIETTLCLIEENNGIKDVNLRGIAKKMGCNHTNLYNYFSCLDEIFWEALGQALLKMINYSENNLEIEIDPEERLFLFLLRVIDFSFEHTGWYRLIWLESIKGEPSDEIDKILYIPGKNFTKIIMNASHNKISIDKAMQISGILYSYLHGEICMWINSRSFVDNEEEVKLRIHSTLKYLYKLLVQ